MLFLLLSCLNVNSMIRAIILAIITTLWLTVCVVCSPVIQQSPKHLLQTEKEKQAKLYCHHGDNSYPYLYWYQQKSNGGSLELIGMLSYEAASPEDKFKLRFNITGHAKKDAFLIISNISAEDSAVYFCAVSGRNNYDPAYFGKGTKLTVLDPKIKVSEEQDLNVTIIKPSEKESCKKTVTLVCVAKDFYPDHVSITWMVGGKPRTEGVATDPNAFREQETEHFTISSRLKVPRKEWNNEKTEFKCTLKFYDGKDYLYKENKVNGIAGSGYTREDYVKSSQMIKLSYGVFIAKSALYGLVIFVYVWRKGSGK